MEEKLKPLEKKQTIRVAVVGARGYSGLELTRLLLRHPYAQVTAAFATTPFELSALLPESKARTVPCYAIADLKAKAQDFDLVFLAIPAEASIELAPQLINMGLLVIDLSGGFRLQAGTPNEQSAAYRQWYHMEHSATDLLAQAEFGLVPWAQPKKGVKLISNPGCYATAVMMGILPVLKANLIDTDSLVIDAKSGATGAGRKASENLLFSEVEAEVLPYKVGKHQHLPEIEQWTERFAGVKISPFFTTHLLPVRRGLIASIYARFDSQWKELNSADLLQKVEAAFQDAYGSYPLVDFATLEGAKGKPNLAFRQVVGTGRTMIRYQVAGDKLFLFSLIDNLGKGAASQAVENMNRLFDFPVATGVSDMEGVL